MHMIPLIRCRACESKLLQVERIWALADGRNVAHRRCPECDMRDRVTVGSFALKLWMAREQRLREELDARATALADGAPVDVALA